MRLVSWNIELGKNVELAAEELAATRISNRPLAEADIILVQELDDVGANTLATKLGMDLRYEAPASHPDTGRPFGNAILSRWPMGESEMVTLPHTAFVQGQPRAATTTTIEVAGSTVRAYSVHLETVLLDVPRRVRQVRTVADDTRKRSAPIVVIGGDFNTASRRSSRAFNRPLSRAGFSRVSAPNAKTFERFGRPFTLDHLYAKGHLAIDDCGVIAEARASDHQPVWADLHVPRADA